MEVWEYGTGGGRVVLPQFHLIVPEHTVPCVVAPDCCIAVHLRADLLAVSCVILHPEPTVHGVATPRRASMVRTIHT